MTQEDKDAWSGYQRLVMDKLDSLETGLKETRAEVASLGTAMEVQKVKAGMWGALAGAVPAGILLALHYFSGGKKQ